MNYDGLALVVECNKQIFKSVNGFCDVITPLILPNPLTDNDEINVADSNIIPPPQKKYTTEAYVYDDSNMYGVIPITVNVTSSMKKNIKFCITTVDVLQVRNNFAKKCDVNCKITMPVTLIDRSNITFKKTATNVIDKNIKNKIITFPYTTVEVTDKTQITVPDTSELSGFTIVLQKNNFTELEFQKTLSLVTGLPEGLERKNQIIKGTITKSGNYIVNVTYSDGAKQTLNIIVPYYQRLL